MSQWNIQELGTLLRDKGYIRGPFGSALKRGEMVEEGIPVYEQKNAIYDEREFRFFITPEKFEELKRFQVKANDLIISCSGTVGKISIIKDEDPKGIISQALLILRPDVEKITLKFLYYFLTSKHGFNLITQVSHGSVQINIAARKIVETIPVPTPPLKEQRAIASVLSSLDDKIDLLHRQNQTLEQMAETLFRQWFVETEDESMDLTDFIQINPTESLKKGVSAPYLEMKNLDTKSANPNNWYDREFTSGTKFRNGDTVMARITPCLENGKKAYIQFMGNGQLGWGSTEFLVFRTFADFHPFSSYLLAMNDDFKAFAEKTMTGSSGRQRVQTDSLKKYSLNRPTPRKLKELNHSFKVYSEKLKLNQTQIRTLTALRDTLLPKLMSGEVRVADTPVIALKKTKEARPEFKEAILIAAIVRTLFTPKIGNVSRQWYQKIAYLHKRKLKELNEQQSVFELTREYSKKAAGPYKQNMRYQGPEGICLNNKYLEAVNDYAFKPSEAIDKIDTYFDNYWNRELFENWTLEKFRFVPVKKLGVYATVDYSLLELKKEGKELSASNVLDNISESKDWEHKKDLPEFSPQNIEQAIHDLKNLYTY